MNSQIFPITDGPQILAGLKLRPFTLGTMELCRQLNLSMFCDGEVPEDTNERVRQVAAYLFIQSEPLALVLAMVDSKDFDRECLRPFKFRLTPAVIDAAIDVIGKNLQGAGEMVVEVEQKPSMAGAKEETAPPNS